ncbi:hypothetical protein TrST_g756 [Triparma strigata]|uniref:DNA/RNA non-specific endonuclease domain-containing protein n=1 Tax=Triparma strigata TaxID=1606541 RepID=A0A9W7EAS2_9STRA|nr:hypothetical protein TrST_g756 [Triparma strigata]
MELSTKSITFEEDDSKLVGGSKKSGKSGKRGTFKSASFRMEAAFLGAQAYEGSVYSLWRDGNAMVKTCLGPGHFNSLLLLYQVAANVFANIFLAMVISALILMFYGDAPTTLSPHQLASGMVFFALGFAINRMVKSLILTHVGKWFMRRAKYAINQKVEFDSSEHEADVMANLALTKNLFITSWMASSSNICTEAISICMIAAFSLKLFGIAVGLFLFGKAISTLDDMYLVGEQHKIFEIAKNLESDDNDADNEANHRFFHNRTTTQHQMVSLAYILYAYMGPVFFIFAASSLASDGSVGLSSAMSSCVFFLVAAMSALHEHGSVQRVIKKLHATSKLLAFDKKHGGVFVDYFAENPNPEIPYSATKNSSQFSYTHTEKAGFIFTLVTIAVIIIGGIAFVSSADVTFSCSNVEVACGHVPEDGSTVMIEVESTFSFTQGCTLSESIPDIVKACADAVLDTETGTLSEVVDWDLLAEDDNTVLADVEAEEDAIQEMQSNADASASQQILGGNQQTVVISAKYETWSTPRVFQQVFTVTDKSSSRRNLNRRLSEEDDYVFEEKSDPAFTYFHSESMKESFDIDIIVGSSRYDGSKDNIEAFFVGKLGTSPLFPLGKKWNKAESRSVRANIPDDIGTLTGIVLISGGKDGLKFKSIKVDGVYDGGMKSFLKCRGSKRKGTWNCEQFVPLFRDTGDECVKECDPALQPAVPTLPTDGFTPGASVTMLSYAFGKVWNDCDKKGAVRFTYNATCDTGCFDRHGSFKLSPDPTPSGSGYGGNAIGDCQQKNGNAYPTYCVTDSGATQMAKASDDCVGTKVGHDRGHQVPANNFDDDETTIEATNFMTNIMPQAAQMNRGAWLKTEMMVECWQNEVPISVLGGAVSIGDGGKQLSDVPEWGDMDRSDWFVSSHGVKNPAYFWKVIFTAPQGPYTKHDYIAFWMPNHESAKSSNIDDYIVSLAELETKLAAWGAAETFTLVDGDWEQGKDTKYATVWQDPMGCSRA